MFRASLAITATVDSGSLARVDYPSRTIVVTVLAVAIVGVAALYMGGLGPFAPAEGDYERTTVTVLDDDGDELATVDVRVADTHPKRVVGLSNTESLSNDEGMLFVHDSAGNYGYVMRDMAFPIDIIFIAPNGTITTIHHAPVEPNASGSELTQYRGYGRYVLEVPYGYTNETGIETGHTVRIEGRWGPE
jgi:uncharacterized membrane protein (UPF0127 family)